MGWGRYLLLGDFGQQMDLSDQRNELQRVRSSVEGQQYRDRQQDDQIRQLQQENVELKLTLNRLAHLLVSRGVVSADDVTKLAGELERAEGPPGGRT
jgi:hypothetical protein